MINKLRNFRNKIRELGIREGVKFYLNNLLFGEQVNFNTKFLIIFLLKDYFNFKEKRIKEFFGPDISFFNKMNVPASYFYDNCRKGNVKFLKHKSEEGKLYFLYKKKYELVTDYSVGIIIQIFCLESYKFNNRLLSDGYKYVLFDLGMNKGFSSMWFAMDDKIDRVVGYEINPLLKEYIFENAEKNKELFKKIEVNIFGLSDKNSKQKFYSLKNDDGVGTMNKEFHSRYWSDSRKNKGKKIDVNVKKASTELREQMKKSNKHRYILKIDVEGAEYETFDDLSSHCLINSFDIILGESHAGVDRIKEHLKEFDFIDIKRFPGNLATFVAVRKRN